MSASSLPFDYKPIPLVAAVPRPAARIVIRNADWKDFTKKAGASGRAQAESVMKLYIRFGPEDLPRDKFVHEERYEAGGRKARIQTFKGFQTRLYGFEAQVDGQRTFFITRLDLAKKDDKAKRRVLDAAGKEAIKVLKALA